MTEQEAKTKWCPQVETGAYRPNPDGANIRLSFCIGSACMAWRWKPKPLVESDRFGPQIDSEYGFCGLAGKP